MDSGQVSPTVVPMQNGVANTHDHDVQQAQQSLARDVSAQLSDAATLNNDTSLSQAVGDIQKDYEQERSDWQTEQNTACSTDEVGGDADTVGGDADTAGGDLDDLNGDVTDLQDGDTKSVQTDLSNVASDLSTLRDRGAPPGTPSSAAVAAGNKALTSAANAISWANGQGQKSTLRPRLSPPRRRTMPALNADKKASESWRDRGRARDIYHFRGMCDMVRRTVVVRSISCGFPGGKMPGPQRSGRGARPPEANEETAPDRSGSHTSPVNANPEAGGSSMLRGHQVIRRSTITKWLPFKQASYVPWPTGSR